MTLEETLNVPYLPRNGYENPVTLAVKDYLLEVSYLKDALYLQKHFIDEKGMSKGYEISKLRPYPKSIIEAFIQNELKERYCIEKGEKYLGFNEAPDEIKKNILKILLSYDDFRISYHQLQQGYYEKFSFVKIEENKPTLSNEEFLEVSICYRIMKDALKLVKDEEIKFYLSQADLFDMRLLLFSRTYLNGKRNNEHSKNTS